MELRHLRYFIAVAEELHFGRAAERLHIAQPPLSIQIMQLENELGGKLFYRTKRRVSLTEAGKLFLIEARKTLQQFENAEETAKRAMLGQIGHVDIGYSANAAYSGLLGQAVRSAKKASPDIDIRLTEDTPRNQLDLLLERKLHVGLMSTLVLDIPRELVTSKLASWPIRIVLPESHRLAGEKSVSPDDLRNERFITYSGSRGNYGAQVVEHILGFVPDRIDQATSTMMVTALIGAEIGIGLLPTSLEHLAPHTGIVFKKLTGVSVEMDCCLVHWRSEFEPAVKSFIATARKTLLPR